MTIERKTVSQCSTAEYCRGWNDAVELAENEVKKFAKKVADELEKRATAYRENWPEDFIFDPLDMADLCDEIRSRFDISREEAKAV